MSEADWYCSDDIPAMINYLIDVKHADRTPDGLRKLRLFACGCCRRAWHLLDSYPEIRESIEAAEGHADGKVSISRMRKAIAKTIGISTRQRSANHAPVSIGHIASAARCACGARPHTWLISACESISFALGFNPAADAKNLANILRCIVNLSLPTPNSQASWITQDCIDFAKAIYISNSFENMHVLSDLLEDAGCDDLSILEHCRNCHVHLRGCWVLDLVLGKGQAICRG